MMTTYFKIINKNYVCITHTFLVACVDSKKYRSTESER